MAEKQKKAENPKKGKVLRNVGIISAIGAVIMFIVRSYFNSEISRAKNSPELYVQVGYEKMTVAAFADFANEIIGKCNIAIIAMAVIAVVLIASYIMMNKKKSDQ